MWPGRAADRDLSRYEDWRDTAQWPTLSRESGVVKKTNKHQQDPLNKEGLVGVFCRTNFPVQTALEKFLPGGFNPAGRGGPPGNGHECGDLGGMLRERSCGYEETGFL